MIGNTVKISTVFIAATLLAAPPLPLATAQTKPSPKAPEVEFVQTAKSVAFKDGVLTLQDVAPATVFFSDRPQRLVGHVRNDLFLKRWTEGGNSFKSDPPNAVLSVFNDKGQPTNAIVLLSNPRIEGKNMLYDAKTLKGTLPATGGEGTLFIDGSGAPCDPAFNQGDSGYPCWAQQAFAAAGGGL